MGDLGLPFSNQPLTPVDEKPGVIEDFFDFDSFPEYSPTTTTATEPIFDIARFSSVDAIDCTPFNHTPQSNSHNFLDGLDAKFYGLQSASGATLVSDDSLAAEQL